MQLKYSRQREAIKEFMITRKDHPSADVVYENVRKDFPNISLGTVYRNLTLLADLGEIARLRVGDGVDHFDADTSLHYHFVCTECEKVIDVKGCPVDEEIDRCIELNNDVKVFFHKVLFYGLCTDCKNNEQE